MSIVNTMASTRSQFQLREAGDTVQSDNVFVTWVVCGHVSGQHMDHYVLLLTCLVLCVTAA